MKPSSFLAITVGVVVTSILYYRSVSQAHDKSQNASKRLLESLEMMKKIHETVSMDGSPDSVLDAAIGVSHCVFGKADVGFVDINNKQSKYFGSTSIQHADIVNLVRNCNQLTSFSDDNICVLCGSINTDGICYGKLFAIAKIEDRSNFDNNDTIVFQAILDNVAMSLKTSNQIAITLREKRRSEALMALMRARGSDYTLDKVLKTTIDIVDKLLQPELASIYLCDQLRREASVCACKRGDEGFEGFTVSFDQGIAGHVASTGQVVRIENAYEDIRFYSTADQHTGNRTRTMMCLPVIGFSTALPLALVQVVNKQNGQIFDEEDEESLFLITTELSQCLKMFAKELYELNMFGTRTSKISMPKLEASLLQEYGSSMHKYRLTSSAEKVCLSVFANDSEVDFQHRLRMSPTIAHVRANGLVANYNVDPSELPHEELVDLLVFMFRAYGLLAKFSLPEDVLRNFLAAVHSYYHNENPYHNFEHIWSVTHLCYQILRAGADQYLTSLDILALLIAAICHDIDHPGNNNAFEVACQSELAALYADDIVLERHHAAMTLKLLSSPDLNFLRDLKKSERQLVRKLITSSIMGTDMGHHFETVSQLEAQASLPTPFDKTDAASRALLLKCILHAADIGSQTQTQPLASKWSDRIAHEFSQQADKELEKGLDVTPFMSGLDDEIKKNEQQHGFVTGIALPLWSALSTCFPNLQFATNTAVDNKQYYLDRVVELRQKAKESCTSSE